MQAQSCSCLQCEYNIKQKTVNEAIRDWVTNVEDTHYVIGSVVGPHPYPKIVRDFQRIIGDEAKKNR